MRNTLVTQKHKDEYLLDRISEVESLVYLLQKWTEGGENLTIKHALSVLESCVMETYRTACWSTVEQVLGGDDE
ncbi:hypothetical protein ACUHGC_02530 [Testudinibacter sp. P27/CKL/0425]